MSQDNITTLTDLSPRTETGTFLGTSRHTDADSMRREFGIPAFDESVFDYPSVVPGCLKHARDNSAWTPAGGTDFMAFGKPGSGKSTHALYWAIRTLEVNNRPGMSEAVVWRASESRSEWTPLAPWATVCLPASCDVEATLSSTDPDNPGSREVALEDVVREVVRYEDPKDLFQNHIQPGRFHVVYPDPQFRGCQELYEESPKRYDLSFEHDDPVKHWWVAAVMARVEHGPYSSYVSFFFDEIGDLLSQDASKDQFSSYQKIQLFRDLYVDGRKFGVSFFCYGHSPEDVHEKVRRKVRWHVTMNGVANPTRASQVVGVGSVPMNTDLSSRLPLGKCLMWTETNFCYPVVWKDIPKPTKEELRVRLSPRVPKDPADAPSDVEEAKDAHEDATSSREVRADGGMRGSRSRSSTSSRSSSSTGHDPASTSGGGSS